MSTPTRPDLRQRAKALEEALELVNIALVWDARWFKDAFHKSQDQALEVMTHAVARADIALKPALP